MAHKKNRRTIVHLSQRRNTGDEALVQRAIERDGVAQEQIYTKYAPLLTNMLVRLLGNSNDADDVVQETFIVAFEKIKSLNEPAALKSWLRTIAVNEMRKRERRRRLLQLLPFRSSERYVSLEQLAVADAQAEVHAELRRIDAQLMRVSKKWRLAWMLRKVEGMTISETASAMKCAEATVKRYVEAVEFQLREVNRENHND